MLRDQRGADRIKGEDFAHGCGVQRLVAALRPGPVRKCENACRDQHEIGRIVLHRFGCCGDTGVVGEIKAKPLRTFDGGVARAASRMDLYAPFHESGAQGFTDPSARSEYGGIGELRWLMFHILQDLRQTLRVPDPCAARSNR